MKIQTPLAISGCKFFKTLAAANPVNVFYDSENLYLQTVNASGAEISLETRKRDPELISRFTGSVH